MPISHLEELTPWLEKYYSYELSMISSNIWANYNWFLQSKAKYSGDDEEVLKKIEGDIEFVKQILVDNHELKEDAIPQFEDILKNSKGIYLETGSITYEAISKIYSHYYPKEIEAESEKQLSEIAKKEQNICYTLYIIAILHHKYKVTHGLFYLENIINDNEVAYVYDVRPDLLNLYLLFNEEKRSRHNDIRIEYKGEKIDLKNYNNWFLEAITPFLDQYLQVNNPEEARDEYEYEYNQGAKKGRKKINQVSDWILMGTYNLIKDHSILHDLNKALTDKEANFLLDYLKYLELIEPDSNKDDVLNLRATVNNLKKYTLEFSWWNMPKHKYHYSDPRIEKQW